MIRICMFPASNPKNEVVEITVKAIEETGKAIVIPYCFGRSFFQKFDVLHVHWPDAVVFPTTGPRLIAKYFLFCAFLIFAKLRHRKIVWTAHNIGSHEQAYPILERLLWALFLSVTDHIIHLCPDSYKALAIWRPSTAKIPQSMIPHPHYRSVYPKPLNQREARRELNVATESFVLLFFGMIRPYKGVDKLIKVFNTCGSGNDILIIAGEIIANAEVGTEIRREIRKNRKIRFLEGFHSREMLSKLLAAADCVVLPYEEILNSGVAAVTLSHARPILAPNTGCIKYYCSQLGSQWVHLLEADFEASLAKAHAAILSSPTNSTPDLDFAEPAEIARATAGLYQCLLENV